MSINFFVASYSSGSLLHGYITQSALEKEPRNEKCLKSLRTLQALDGARAKGIAAFQVPQYTTHFDHDHDLFTHFCFLILLDRPFSPNRLAALTRRSHSLRRQSTTLSATRSPRF